MELKDEVAIVTGGGFGLGEAFYFLVSPASVYITGEVLDCNGGMVMD